MARCVLGRLEHSLGTVGHVSNHGLLRVEELRLFDESSLHGLLPVGASGGAEQTQTCELWRAHTERGRQSA